MLSAAVFYTKYFLWSTDKAFAARSLTALTPTWSRQPRASPLRRAHPNVPAIPRRSDVPWHRATDQLTADRAADGTLAVSSALPKAEQLRKEDVSFSRYSLSLHARGHRCSTHCPRGSFALFFPQHSEASFIPQQERMLPQDEESALCWVRLTADTITISNTCLQRRTSRILGVPAFRNASRLLRTAHSCLTQARGLRKAQPRSRPQGRPRTFWNAPAQREARAPTAGTARALREGKGREGKEREWKERESASREGRAASIAAVPGGLREGFLPSVALLMGHS